MDQQGASSIYYPMLVSSNGTADHLTHEEDTLVWKKYLTLSQEKRDIITANELSQKLHELQKKLNLNDAAIGSVSLIVRKIFFGEVTLDKLAEDLKGVLVKTGDDAGQAAVLSEYIQKEILTIKPKPRVEEADEEEKKAPMAMARLPLLQALSKYEQLGNQLITRERIRIKSQQEPVRPSLLYWIKYYRDELGIGHHNSVQRGDLLFRSENGKKLSPEERERVNLVLKSVEENIPLEIDTERSEIIFPTFELPPTAPRASFQTPPLAPKKSDSREGGNEAFSFGRGTSFVETPAPQADSGSLSFSSKHIFPAEKPEMKTSSAPLPKTLSPKPKPNPFHIRPVSLGKTDES